MTAAGPPPGAVSWPGAPVDAVTVDLDDTVFGQADYLDGVWQAVAAAAEPAGVDPAALLAALRRIAGEGSDRGRIIDRALAAVAGPAALAPTLVSVFHEWRPARLDPFPGAVAALRRLRSHGPLGLVTDGNPGVQRAKIAALGLADGFDAVVISDEMARSLRKPHPAPFRRALYLLGAHPDRTVHIGDRPAKDVTGAAAAGMRCIRVRTGEYAHVADDPQPWATCPTLADAADWLLDRVASHRAAG